MNSKQPLETYYNLCKYLDTYKEWLKMANRINGQFPKLNYVIFYFHQNEA